MTAPTSIDLSGWLTEQLAEASPDLLRQMITTFVQALMGAEGADPSPRSPWNGAHQGARESTGNSGGRPVRVHTQRSFMGLPARRLGTPPGGEIGACSATRAPRAE
jgi:putative transposase